MRTEIKSESADSASSAGQRAANIVLRLQGVSAGYTKASVLNALSMEVGLEECVAVLGPNGVGKTTTMRAICGVLAPRGGRIEFQGQPISGLPPHRIVGLGVAMVPEGRRLYSGMTVRENLQMGAYILPRHEAQQRLESIYETFPILKERSSQLAGTMSGGQQQLCAIGRALMSNPRLLLVDELSLGLSPLAIKQVIAALRTAIRALRLTVVVVDQDVNVAAGLASRGYFIDRGTVVRSGPMQELVNIDLVRNLYFGPANPGPQANSMGGTRTRERDLS